MFKLFVLIDCDLCGESFRRIALSTDRGPHAWQYLTAVLEMNAQSDGWDLYCEHRCYDCIEILSSKSTVTPLDEDCSF